MRTLKILYTIVLLLVVAACSKKMAATKTNDQSGNKSSSADKIIYWDTTSLQRLAPQKGRDLNYCGYPRMIQLHDKSLICVYETAGGNVESIKSNDRGNSWSAPVIIATRQNGINMAVPEILELADRSLLVSYNPRPAPVDSNKYFGIRTKKSYDGGLIWTDERLLYQAGPKFEDGCWEPSQIQLPSGEVILFFSNEGIYKTTNEQDISVFRSADNGLTWTETPQIVSFTKGSRDGMPVPVLSADKKSILFSIEDNGSGQFKPAIIKTDISNNVINIINGSDKNRWLAVADPLPDTVYAGAPYLRRLSSGETILSFQSTENRTGDWKHACMVVAVGDVDGKNFYNKSTPFKVPLNKQGLWNSLCVLDDDTIIALTSTNAFSERNPEVWMIRGRLVNKTKDH